MNYNVRGENIEVTPALRDHVEKKLESWSVILSQMLMLQST